MPQRAKVFGQPLNPLLTVLPLGILGSAVLVDLGALISGRDFFGVVAHADMTVGLIAGVVSLCAVLIYLITAPAGSTSRQVLSVVAALTGAMVATFTVIWSVRADGGNVATGGVLFLEVIALTAGGIAAGLARRLALGLGLPQRYLAAGAAAGRCVVVGSLAAGRCVVLGSVWAAEAVRRTPRWTRLLR